MQEVIPNKKKIYSCLSNICNNKNRDYSAQRILTIHFELVF